MLAEIRRNTFCSPPHPGATNLPQTLIWMGCPELRWVIRLQYHIPAVLQYINNLHFLSGIKEKKYALLLKRQLWYWQNPSRERKLRSLMEAFFSDCQVQGWATGVAMARVAAGTWLDTPGAALCDWQVTARHLGRYTFASCGNAHLDRKFQMTVADCANG